MPTSAVMLLLCALPVVTLALPVSPKPDPVDTKATLTNLEYRRANAWIAKDKAALAALLHPDYLELNIFGRFTRQQVLDELFDRHVLIDYAMSDIEFRELGSDVCALCYYVVERLQSAGTVSQYHCVVTATYKKTPTGWLLAIWQITPIAG